MLKELPLLGYGTALAPAGKIEVAVETALKSGCKLLDCASVYGNEKEVGDGLARSGVDRDSIWITSKLWITKHRPHLVKQCLDKTLSDLGTSYVVSCNQSMIVYAFNHAIGSLLGSLISLPIQHAKSPILLSRKITPLSLAPSDDVSFAL